MNFTVYLARPGFSHNSVLIDGLALSKRHTVGGAHLYLVWEQKVERPPPWAGFVTSQFAGSLSFSVMNCRALVLVVVKGRLFLLPFGPGGRFLFHQDTIVRDFGLRVVASASGTATLRGIDVHSQGFRRLRARHQSTQGTEMTGFNFDPSRDFVNAMAGKASGGELSRMGIVGLSGSDGLRFSAEISASELPNLCPLLLTHYNDTSAFSRFPALGKLELIQSPSERGKLDKKLLAELLKKKPVVHLDFDPPDVLDNLLDVIYFIGKKSDRQASDRLEEVKKALSKKEHLRTQLEKQRVYRLADDELISLTHLYNCVSTELQLGDATYVLYQGDWYRVDREFLKELNEVIDDIPSSGLNLVGVYTEEKDYNEGMAAQLNGSCLDRESIAPPGQDEVEPCDIFLKPLTFIHVKRNLDSSDLSHLFNQGLVSAELIQGNSSAWDSLHSLDPSAIPKERPDSKLTVCYVILSERDRDKLGGQPNSCLPFFSKISLRRVARQLQLMNASLRLDIIKNERTPEALAKIAERKAKEDKKRADKKAAAKTTKSPP